MTSLAKSLTVFMQERSSLRTMRFSLPVVATMSLQAAMPLDMLRQPRMTRAPREARSRAVSRPMPETRTDGHGT